MKISIRFDKKRAFFWLLTGFLSVISVSVFAAEKPNVLFIAIDDLRAELGCYDSPHIISPNIDKLATQGLLFNRAYCQQAVCNPSRASMLTGLTPQTLQIYTLPPHFRERRPEVVTLPQHFKNNGYFTRGIGKIFHNWRQEIEGDAMSWSVPEVIHYNTHSADKAMLPDGVEVPPDLSDVPKCEIRDVPDEAYFDGRIAALAVEQLADLKTSKEPWFLGVGFWKPHSHFNAPKKYWDLYDETKISRASNPNPPKNVPEIALHDGREIMRDFKKRPNGKPTPVEEITLRHGYYANISYMDTQVGKVLNALEANGLRDSTIVVFWSDHGFHLGENSLWAKTSNFELDARVPLIIVTPGREGGRRTDALVELLDVYPTLVDLCGLPANDELEGKSLRPILDDSAAMVKNAAFTWHPRPPYPTDKDQLTAMGYSMRTDRYRFTEWRDPKGSQVIAHELYDHQNDPSETVNIASENADLVRELSSQLKAEFPDGAGIHKRDL